MKKLLFMLLCLSARSNTPAYADGNQINLYLSVIDDCPTGHHYGKAPIRMPYIHQDGYTLALSNIHPEYIINIIQGEEVLFSTIIPEGVVTYELPTYLTGECTIQFVSGSFSFYGLIHFLKE